MAERPRESARRASALPLRHPSSGIGAAWGFTAAFLLGYLPGIVAGRSGSTALGGELAAFYLDGQRFSGFGTAFAGLFAGAFVQLSVTMLCGFFALGVPFLAFFFALRGSFLGLGAASVFAVQGAKALVVHWLLNLLPELFLLLMALWLSGYAANVSSQLFRAAFLGGAARGAMSGGVRRLLTRYLIALLLVLPICAISAGLGILFAGILL
ncbi:MAG: hypothetical protein ACI4OI_02115 [Gemmiger sp.]